MSNAGYGNHDAPPPAGGSNQDKVGRSTKESAVDDDLASDVNASVERKRRGSESVADEVDDGEKSGATPDNPTNPTSG